MIAHHPSKEMLLEYSAGSLGVAPSIAVATHLQYCSHCRQQVESFNALGAACWNGVEKETKNHPPIAPVDTSLFERVMAACTKYDAEQALSTEIALSSHYAHAHQKSSASKVVSLRSDQPSMQASYEGSSTSNSLRHQDNILLPELVSKLVRQSLPLRWRRLSPAIQIARLTAGQDHCEVSLIKIKAGGKVLEHDHKGHEWTLVLDGAFSDHQGVYQAGDFLQQSPGHVHAPQATANKDCLCLSVSEAPIRFTGLLSRLLNPFLSVRAQ